MEETSAIVASNRRAPLNGFLTKLKNRHARFSREAPSVPWKAWASITTLLVFISVICFDAMLHAKAQDGSQWLHRVAELTTDLGKSGWILFSAAFIAAAGFWLSRQGRIGKTRYWATLSGWAGTYVFLSVAISGILANLAKRTIGRARPKLFDDVGHLDFSPFYGSHTYESFPSGHSTTDGALVMALAMLFPAYRIPILILGFTLAMTRVWVGAHYPSDVIAGFSFGMWYAFFSAIFFARYGLLFDGKLRLRMRS